MFILIDFYPKKLGEPPIILLSLICASASADGLIYHHLAIIAIFHFIVGSSDAV